MNWRKWFECFPQKCKLQEIEMLTDLIKLSRRKGIIISSGYKCIVCGALKEKNEN